MNEKIVIVEDDVNTRRLLEFILDNEGYKPFAFEDAQAALDAVEEIRPDLAIVDLMMPDMDGVELSRKLRAQARYDKMPILVVTARDHAVDRYEAFAVGVDDYITKPFDTIELTCRVRAFLRLVGSRTPAEPMTPIEVGGLKLDPARFTVTVRGQDIVLTRLETAILHYLMKHAGQVYSAEQLSSSILAEGGRSVDAAHAHIRNLRNKIELNPKEPKIVVTMGRKGYYFAR